MISEKNRIVVQDAGTRMRILRVISSGMTWLQLKSLSGPFAVHGFCDQHDLTTAGTFWNCSFRHICIIDSTMSFA